MWLLRSVSVAACYVEDNGGCRVSGSRSAGLAVCWGRSVLGKRCVRSDNLVFGIVCFEIL